MSDYTSDYSTYSATTPPLPSPESISLSPAISNGTSTSFLPTSSSAPVYPSSLLPSSSSSSSAALLPNDFDPGAQSDEFLALSPEEGEAQLRAINTWTKRVQLCFVAHLVSAMALLRTDFWSDASLHSLLGLRCGTARGAPEEVGMGCVLTVCDVRAVCRISSVLGLLLLLAFYLFAHFMKIRRKNVSGSAAHDADTAQHHHAPLHHLTKQPLHPLMPPSHHPSPPPPSPPPHPVVLSPGGLLGYGAARH